MTESAKNKNIQNANIRTVSFDSKPKNNHSQTLIHLKSGYIQEKLSDCI